MLDDAGRDTELARFLHGCGRLDRHTLHGLLNEARRSRSAGGGTLARVLVERGLLPVAEVEASLQRVAAGASIPSRPSGRFDALVQPPPSTGRLHVSDVHGPASDRHPDVQRVQTGRLQQSGVDNSLQGPNSGPMRRSSGRLGAFHDGAVIGHYRVLEPLGAGAMGQVFLAEHMDTGVHYAVKTLLSSADPGYVARFLREGEAQAKVDSHPNVLRVHAMGELRGLHYLVTEYASGGDLKQVLRKQDRLPADGAARLARDLARGLAHMHAHGVLHRDLKPANILFDANGVAKLADFGLARFEGAQSLTMTGELVGTPVYMPPEQALGLRDKVGPPADVYGLAAIIYQCVAGHPPFDGATTIEVVHKLTQDAVPPLLAAAPDTPPELAKLIHAGLAKEPGDRPDARAWAEAFDAVVTQLERPPEPVSQSDTGSTARGSLKLLVGVALASLVVALSLVGFALVRSGSAATADAAAASPAQAGEVVAATPEPSPVDEAPPPGLVWPIGVERRYRLQLETRGEFPVMGMMRFMAPQGGQQQMHMERSYELVLWAEPRAGDPEAATDDGEDDDWDDEGEWDDDGDWDHEDGEPATEPGVTRLVARIDGFSLEWSALGLRKQFDSDEVAQDEDDRRFGAVLGKTFALGMRPTGEIVWVHGTAAIQQAIYDADVRAPASPDADPDAERGEGQRRRGRNGFSQMQERMTYHVPELVSTVMRDTLNLFFHVLPSDGDLSQDSKWVRILPAPWSIGSGWGRGNTGRSALAPPDLPCDAEARTSRGGDGASLTWAGDNAKQVDEANAEGRVLISRRSRGKASVRAGVLVRSELLRDSYFGEFQVESSFGNSSEEIQKVEGKQVGELELLE